MQVDGIGNERAVACAGNRFDLMITQPFISGIIIN